MDGGGGHGRKCLLFETNIFFARCQNFPKYPFLKFIFQLHSVLFLVAGVQHSGEAIVNFRKCSPSYFQYPSGTVHTYYIIDYIPFPFVVFYIPMAMCSYQTYL